MRFNFFFGLLLTVLLLLPLFGGVAVKAETYAPPAPHWQAPQYGNYARPGPLRRTSDKIPNY